VIKISRLEFALNQQIWRCVVRSIHCSALLIAAVLVTHAQAQTPGASAGGFEKKNYNYSEWTKGLFSEVITVTHPGKMIFLAGVGAEDETGARGAIRHLSDVAGQCRYAYDKIKRLLAAHGATMHDVVKVVTYVTDVRFLPDVGKCRTEALEGAPQPVHTFLNINQLAWPGMLVEVDVIAITKAP
jgi:enamine deaminase RidA (YjgF/YER057c/UK114 family)